VLFHEIEGVLVESMRKIFTLAFAIVSILAVVLALFVAPLKATPNASNAPSDWEIISGGFSEDGTQLLPTSVAVWNQPLPNGCAIQTKTLNKKALRTWIVDGQDFDSSGLTISEYVQQGPQFYAETNLLWVDNIINDGSFAYDQNLFRVRGWSDERLVDADMFGEEWDRTHYNVNPLSFFLGTDGYLYYSEDYWHEFPSLGRVPPTGSSAVRVSKANETKPNPRVFFGAANSSDTINRNMRWGHFTDFYPIDCDFVIDDDGDGTLNWYDTEWFDANSPTLTTPTERVVCPENLDECIDWSDCDIDFDNDGVVNCNDYSVSDPSIWDICQLEDSCSQDVVIDRSGDPELEGDNEIDGCIEDGACLEIADEPADQSIEGNSEEIVDEVVEVEVPEEEIEAPSEPEISQEQATESTVEISGPVDVDDVIKLNERAVKISSEGTIVTIAASGGNGISIDGTTLNAFNSSTFEISGSGFLPNSTIELYVYSDPYLLGVLDTDANGEFVSSLSLPTDLDPGWHRFEVVGIGADNAERKIEYSFSLVDQSNPSLFQEKGMFDDTEGSAKTIGGLAAVAAAVAAAGAAAGGSAGGSSGSSSPAPTAHRVAITAARGASARFNSSSSSDNVTDDEVESLEIIHDTFLSEDEAWGDKLSLWDRKSMTALDFWWTKATIDSARFSPFLSKTLNDGSYLRSGAGTLWGLLPISSILFSLWALFTNVGPVGEPGWAGLTGVMVLGVFDIFSGLIGISIIILGYLIIEASTNDIGALADIRFAFGLFSLACGPAILATSIRTIRKPAARKRIDWWDRIVDLTVGTFIAGWMTLILVAVLTQYASIGLEFETVGNEVAISIALAFLGRVVLEEIVARNFSGRLNRLNPTAVPDQESGMKWTAIVIKALVTVFLSVAFLGNCWQLWVGVLLFSVPSIINEFQDRFPSKPKINRYIPQQTPTLTIVEICIVGILGILLATIGAGPSMIRTGFMLFAIPPIGLAITNAIGRETASGHGTWYLDPQFTRWYRVGGFVVLLVLVYLSEVFGSYLPLFV